MGESPSKEPGNFGDPLSLGQYDTEMRSRELNNGRFAMFAALGIISAELLTGMDATGQFGRQFLHLSFIKGAVRFSGGFGILCFVIFIGKVPLLDSCASGTNPTLAFVDWLVQPPFCVEAPAVLT